MVFVLSLFKLTGGEFRPFQSLFADLAIVHRVIYSHTHHQNGTVERKHRHLVETGLNLLSNVQMPLKYWDHAFITASYLIDRLPTEVLNIQSPFAVLYKKLSHYQFLKTFGCACYHFVPTRVETS